ncbi:MAG: TerC family protein [Actinocatenispora sp.]
MAVPLWVWLATLAGIGALIAVDIWHARKPHVVAFREALLWSVVYVATALVFGAGVWLFAGREYGTEYIAGYLVEKSLSVDNLFVFAVILGRFAVPARHQQRVLLIGVVGALVLRAVFIVLGAAAVDRFAVTFVLFGAFLIYTAIQLLRPGHAEPDVGRSRAVRLVRRFVPVTEDYAEGRLLVRRDHRWAATPLLLVAVTILSVDLVFALDSIPAIFGITDVAYLVFTANAFALLGLRALYFLLIGMLDRLVHLKYGLAAVLAFIGVKLILHYVHGLVPAVPEISTGLSLLVIFVVLAVVTVTSLRATRAGRPRPEPADDGRDPF